MKKTIALALVIAACNKPPTTQQIGAATDAACTLLDAFASSPEEEALCATADDLAAIANSIRLARADAGPGRKSGICRIVPTQTVCATDGELAAAIKARKASR